jgi:acetylornithine deacetylase/succinyl-diaminopimelate desuccinylase-like protein
MPDSDLIELLRSMIRIDSRNTLPMEQAGERVATEQAMGEFVAETMREYGFSQVEFHYIAPQRPNVLGIHQQNPAFPTLAFEAHLDTVGTDGMSIPPFEPDIRDGRIYGRGSCDTKGSLAAMLSACRQVIKEKLPINLLFLASSAEETGCQGAPFWDLRRWPIGGIVIGEPTLNQPIVAHKAHLTFELQCHGKAAHGSRPEAGDNAILKAGKILAFLEKVIIPELSSLDNKGFDSGNTLSPGMIKGGTKANIVPDHCVITCDMRLLPGSGDPMDLLKQLCQRASAELGFKVELGYTHLSAAMESAAGHPLLQRVEEAMNKLKIPCQPGTVAYCTDGGVLSSKGYTCVVLGPGDILNAHAAVEFVEIEQLRQAAQIYHEIARQAAASGL